MKIKLLVMLAVVMCSGCMMFVGDANYPSPASCLFGTSCPCWITGHNWAGNSPSEIQRTGKHYWCTKCGVEK